jgi:tellurite resistance protein
MVLFETKKTKNLKSHLANLVAIANSDGDFSVAEKRLIFDIGVKNGLSIDEVKKIIKSDSKAIEFKVPDNDAERFDELYDLASMMLADGECTEDELSNCIELAEKLGFRKAITGVLVRRIVTLQQTDGERKSKEEIKILCGDFLKF